MLFEVDTPTSLERARVGFEVAGIVVNAMMMRPTCTSPLLIFASACKPQDHCSRPSILPLGPCVTQLTLLQRGGPQCRVGGQWPRWAYGGKSDGSFTIGPAVQGDAVAASFGDEGAPISLLASMGATDAIPVAAGAG